MAYIQNSELSQNNSGQFAVFFGFARWTPESDLPKISMRSERRGGLTDLPT
jgi:hypothetical protein